MSHWPDTPPVSNSGRCFNTLLPDLELRGQVKNSKPKNKLKKPQTDCPHLGFWHHPQAKFGINQRGGGLGEITLVGQQTATSKTTWAAELGRREEEGQSVGNPVKLQVFMLFFVHKTHHSRYLVKIFGPFGIQVTVRLLGFWFKDSDDFLQQPRQET